MIFVLVGLALVGLAFILVFNGLVVRRNRCETAFSTIDVMLKKRYDLIPNLVATVKGYAHHEAGVFEEVARLRAQAASGGLATDQTVAVNNQITELLRRILVIVEGYPELKASENFLHLQRSLNEIEEQIAAARRAYNAAVLDLNNAVQMFPSSLVASLTGFGPRHFLEAAAPEREAPDVGRELGSSETSGGPP
jgi:LemA protein